jgi:hypothetical protein
VNREQFMCCAIMSVLWRLPRHTPSNGLAEKKVYVAFGGDEGGWHCRY